MRLCVQWLRELRLRRGLTQGQLAAALGCSRAAVSTWETGRGLPRPERLRQLAEFFGVSVAELVECDGPLTLKGLRAAAGLQQRAAAEILKVRPSTYCDVENGRQNLPPRWVPILAAALNVPEDMIQDLTPAL
ncbi:helix-turn-helix domain-containing protein [Streptomyces sp. MCAF7]